jgi:hypothetical protein
MAVRRVSPAEVARLLQLMAARPNRRRRRRPGDLAGAFDEWFDGGAVRAEPGSTLYQFGDGTRATVSDTATLLVTISFPDGITIVLEQR